MLGKNEKLQEQKKIDRMSVEHCLSSFISRVNDAYIMSHTIHDLVNDPDYRKLTIKHGTAAGTPLASKHILPGYWFTVFVATQESYQKVLDGIRALPTGDKETTDVTLGINKGYPQHRGLKEALEQFQRDHNALANTLEKFESYTDTFPQKKPLKRIAQSIACGSYEFHDENDLTCRFSDKDPLCDYSFEATVNVAEFTQFAIDFSKQLVELLRPVIETHKGLQKEVTKMLIGDFYMENA